MLFFGCVKILQCILCSRGYIQTMWVKFLERLKDILVFVLGACVVICHLNTCKTLPDPFHTDCVKRHVRVQRVCVTHVCGGKYTDATRDVHCRSA